MEERTSWQNQDCLKLSVEQWCGFLQDTSIFDENALRMVQFVYHQMNHTSTASDIANALKIEDPSLSYQKVVSWNRNVGRKIYEYFDVIPPADSKGQKRYWNVVFDGNLSCPEDQNKHFYWILRPNLVTAIELLALNR